MTAQFAAWGSMCCWPASVISGCWKSGNSWLPKRRTAGSKLARAWGRLPACHDTHGRLEACPTFCEVPLMDTATVHLEATIGSCALNMSVSVPVGAATVDDFFPLLQIL